MWQKWAFVLAAGWNVIVAFTLVSEAPSCNIRDGAWLLFLPAGALVGLGLALLWAYLHTRGAAETAP